MSNRIIMLVDMNAFYASVHQALNPNLKDKPVIVAGDPSKRHGIILAKSYECKRYAKLQTGMSVAEAEALIPQAIVVKPRFDLYVNFSKKINEILETFTPLVEPFSIDEAFIDVTGCENLFGTPLEIAKKVQTKILTEISITCSIGIGVNKICAKQASEFQKPLGISTLWPHEVKTKLWPLPITELFGIASRLKKRMAVLAIKTIGDLANFDPVILRQSFGIVGIYLWNLANGRDEGPVEPGTLDIVKSIGHQLTLERDYVGYSQISTAIFEICEMVGTRVRARGYVGRTITLHFRDTELCSYSWSKSIAEPTDITEEIYRTAQNLMNDYWPGWKSVRLVGISVSNLLPKKQLQETLFNSREKYQRLDLAIDTIRNRFGDTSLLRGRSFFNRGFLWPLIV